MAVDNREERTVNERCNDCWHGLDEHGPSGCAADDEAAMGGCDCTVTRERPRPQPLPPLLGPGGSIERPFA